MHRNYVADTPHPSNFKGINKQGRLWECRNWVGMHSWLRTANRAWGRSSGPRRTDLDSTSVPDLGGICQLGNDGGARIEWSLSSFSSAFKHSRIDQLSRVNSMASAIVQWSPTVQCNQLRECSHQGFGAVEIGRSPSTSRSFLGLAPVLKSRYIVFFIHYLLCPIRLYSHVGLLCSTKPGDEFRHLHLRVIIWIVHTLGLRRTPQRCKGPYAPSVTGTTSMEVRKLRRRVWKRPAAAAAMLRLAAAAVFLHFSALCSSSLGYAIMPVAFQK